MPVITNGGGGTGGQSGGAQVPIGGANLTDNGPPTGEQQQGIEESASLQPEANNDAPGADIPE